MQPELFTTSVGTKATRSGHYVGDVHRPDTTGRIAHKPIPADSRLPRPSHAHARTGKVGSSAWGIFACRGIPNVTLPAALEVPIAKWA